MKKRNLPKKLKDLKELLANGSDDLDISELFAPKQEEIIKIIMPEIATDIPVYGAVGNIKHSCNPGDVIASMIAVKKYYEITKRKVKFLQKINMPANYYHGASHPTVDERGTMVTMNKHIFEMIKPLVESQEYIDSMEIFEGQRVDVDFDTIRGKTFVNMPNGSLQAWLFYAYPDLASDISKPWMKLEPHRHQIEEVVKDKVILNFTDRYRNNHIILEYYFLKDYAPDLIFAGTEIEHFNFCRTWGVNIPRLQVDDFLQLAHAIRACRFLLCNQSFIWNLATALGTRRLLEVCNFAHNCMPFYGENNLGFFHNQALQHYFRQLYNETK